MHSTEDIQPPGWSHSRPLTACHPLERLPRRKLARLDGAGVRFRLSTDDHNVQMTTDGREINWRRRGSEAHVWSGVGGWTVSRFGPVCTMHSIASAPRDVKNKCDSRRTGQRPSSSVPPLPPLPRPPRAAVPARQETGPRWVLYMRAPTDVRRRRRREDSPSSQQPSQLQQCSSSGGRQTAQRATRHQKKG